MNEKIKTFVFMFAILFILCSCERADKNDVGKVLVRVDLEKIRSDDTYKYFENKPVIPEPLPPHGILIQPPDISDIPPELIAPYFLLINSSNHLTVGTSCGYLGAQTSGFIAIRALAASGRFDLVRLVLTCENPEARIYAAQAMLELQKSGIKLKADDEREISRIRKMNVQIETCHGCLVMYQYAHEILGFKADSPFGGDSIVSPSASFKYSWLQLKYGF